MATTQPRHRGAHAKNNLAAVEQDRAAALEAERTDIVKAMSRMGAYVGNRAVAVAILTALS